MAAPPDDDMLREAARTRRYRLVKSRRRKPGGDFGLYGLVGLDSGRECLGFGEEGLTATADEVLAYLRRGEAASWKRSLIGVVDSALEPPPAPQPSARAEPSGGSLEQAVQPGDLPPAGSGPPRKNSRHPRARGGPASPPAPGPTSAQERGSRLPRKDEEEAIPPSATRSDLSIREATRRDAAALAKLLDLPADTLAERLAAAIARDEAPLVADRDTPIGLIAWTIASTLQHGPRGRITLLLVAKGERRQGIGARLLAAAEQRLRDAGIASVELSLDIDFDAPTAFLRRTGYARTTNGYGKTLHSEEA